MDSQPNGLLLACSPLKPVLPMRWNMDVIPRLHHGDLILAFKAQARTSSDDHDPFVFFLIIPVTLFGGSMAFRNDSLNFAMLCCDDILKQFVWHTLRNFGKNISDIHNKNKLLKKIQEYTRQLLSVDRLVTYRADSDRRRIVGALPAVFPLRAEIYQGNPNISASEAGHVTPFLRIIVIQGKITTKTMRKAREIAFEVSDWQCGSGRFSIRYPLVKGRKDNAGTPNIFLVSSCVLCNS